MIRTGVHFQLAIHRCSELRLGQHAVHGALHEPLGLSRADRARALLAQAALVAAVLTVDLLIFLPSREPHLRGIHDDHVIATVEERGWWFRALHYNLIRAWRSAAPAPAKPLLLDVGCGTGGLLSRLGRDAPEARRFGIDLDRLAAAIALAKSHAHVAVGSTLALPIAPGSLDAVFSADVLCHRGVEPLAALQSILPCLKPGGVVILNLPAYPWLLSGHDHAVDNARRFGRREIESLLKAAGYGRIHTHYWNSLLFPLMVLQRVTHPHGASDVALLPAPIERIFHHIAVFEAWLGDRGLRFPFGGSILATAVRS